MQYGKLPDPGRRVRSADAAVIKAVEHEAALERKALRSAQKDSVRKVRRAKPQRRTAKEAAFYGIHKRSRFTLPLLIILLIVILFGIAGVAAITVYNTDTDMGIGHTSFGRPNTNH